jgi:hypothetical protein
MGKANVAFRSKPITARNQQAKKPVWEPPGMFHFFGLPPELRTHIFHLFFDNHKFTGVLSLLLTSRRMYFEVAAMVYREVLLDATSSRGLPDPRLTGTLTRMAPRRHVEHLIIKFYIKDHVHLFYEQYRDAIKDMAEHGNLKFLQLEVHSRFPSTEYWGTLDWWSEDHWLATGKKKDRQVRAPLFVAEAPFQSFLKFLAETKVPHLQLSVDAQDHYQFWCPFHPSPPSGDKCGGEWREKDGPAMLTVNWKGVVKVFSGAQIVKKAFWGDDRDHRVPTE